MDKKIRFNVIDSVIIIAILAVISALVVRELFGGSVLEKNTDGTKVMVERCRIFKRRRRII